MMTFDLQVAASLLLGCAAAAAIAWGALRIGFPVTPPDDRLGHVDGLRGFLALSVMFHHFTIWAGVVLMGKAWGAPTLSLFNNLGKGGVSLFFMITGAVFYPRILAGIDRVKWPALLISRVFRILPLSIVATLVATFASALAMHGSGRESPGTLPRELVAWLSGYQEPPLFHYSNSYRLNAGVMWSLWYEWGFYLLILPAMAGISTVFRRRLPSYVAPLALLLMSIILGAAMPNSEKPLFLSQFALGMIIAELRNRPRISSIMGKRVTSLVIIVGLLSAMCIIKDQKNPVLQVVYASLLLAVACGNSMHGVLSQRASRVLGDASFSIYMLHGFVLASLLPVFALRLPGAAIFWLPIAVGVALPLSFASYIFIERPMIEIGKRAVHWMPRFDRSLQIESAP